MSADIEQRAHPTIDAALLAELATFSTPSVFNGLQRLGARPADMPTMDREAIRCMSPALGARVGYAATRKDDTSSERSPAAVDRNRELSDRLHEHIFESPEPRILVVENIGNPNGPMCIWGEVMANVNLALGCTAGITNGPVRDLPEMEALGFQTFAGGLAVGGGFARSLEVGEPVTIGGVTVHPGDLLHTDMHGVLRIPTDLAPQLPDAIRAVEEAERAVIRVCQSPDFSLDALAKARAARRH